MKKEEFAKFVMLMRSIWPKFELNNKLQIEVWSEMLKDIPFEESKIVLKKLASELVFQPAIADIRKAYNELIAGPEITAADAWGEVQIAIRNYGTYRELDALESMSEQTRSVVKMIGFKELCISENIMADRAHFIKMYDVNQKRDNKVNQLPEDVRKQIEALSNKLILGGKEDE